MGSFDSGLKRKKGNLISLIILVVFSLPTIASSVDESRFQPFVERHDNGWIDWQEGLIYGVGRGYLQKNENSRIKAQRAANVIASGSIVKLAAGLNLDDAQTLQTIGKGKVVVKLRAFLRDRPHKSSFVEGKDPYYEVVRVASLKGVSGLTAKLIDYFSKDPVWKDFPVPERGDDAELVDEDQPWLLLDARGLNDNDKVSPALFPKIKSDTGETIYDLKGVEEQALKNRGMMNYVVTDESSEDLRSDHRLIENILAAAGLIAGVDEAIAEDGKRRKKRRRYIVKDVKEVQGLAKTNLVVSAKDAKNLKAEDSASRILKKCRVVVIASSPIGGVEGAIPRLLAMNKDDRQKKRPLILQ
jgi:hypothetical protein